MARTLEKATSKLPASLPSLFDEDRCKAYDVFAGDFGSPSDRLLQDSIVTAAKTHKLRCHTCGGVILKGERHRVRSEIVDGELQGYRWCGLCCIAMAKSWDDDGYEIDERTLLHPAMSHLRIEKDYREHSQEHHITVARIVAEIARALQAPVIAGPSDTESKDG